MQRGARVSVVEPTPQPPLTYDLLGLSLAEVQLIAVLMGNMTDSEYDAITRHCEGLAKQQGVAREIWGMLRTLNGGGVTSPAFNIGIDFTVR